jgi:hypothetical protein
MCNKTERVSAPRTGNTTRHLLCKCIQIERLETQTHCSQIHLQQRQSNDHGKDIYAERKSVWYSRTTTKRVYLRVTPAVT